MTLDLSAAFGEAASARLRGLLPSRAAPDTGSGSSDPPESHGSAPDTGSGSSDSLGDHGAALTRAAPSGGSRSGGSRSGDSRSGGSPSGTAPSRAAATARREPSPRAARGVRAVPTENRRWGMARVASREHVDLLVLSALVPGPESASGIIARLREGSSGALEAPERTVHTTLHRLTRNRLLHRVPSGPRGGPRYALTPAGQRAAESRARRWRTFARAVDGVIAQNDAG